MAHAAKGQLRLALSARAPDNPFGPPEQGAAMTDNTEQHSVEAVPRSHDGSDQEVVHADDAGEFLLAGGGRDNPGCECSESDAAVRVDGVHLCQPVERESEDNTCTGITPASISQGAMGEDERCEALDLGPAVANTEPDYNVCPENPDGVHGPLEQNHDRGIGDGWLSVACRACGTTTGVPIPPVQDIEWN